MRKFINRTKPMLIALLIVLVLNTSSSFAEQTHEYNIGRVNQKSTYKNFWLSGTLPVLNPAWTPGTENKINYEFWVNINDSSNYWVEMGYHKGYSWNSDGSVNTNASYEGLFTAKYDGKWSLTTQPSFKWTQAQTHTMGVDFSTSSSGVNYVNYRTDGLTFLSTLASPSNTGTIDAGIEWGYSNDATQGMSSTKMMNMQVLDNGTWKLWSSLSVLTFDDHPGYYTTYDSNYNQLLFKQR